MHRIVTEGTIEESIAAGDLQRRGIIAYRRGNITVLDRAGLEAAGDPVRTVFHVAGVNSLIDVAEVEHECLRELTGRVIDMALDRRCLEEGLGRCEVHVVGGDYGNSFDAVRPLRFCLELLLPAVVGAIGRQADVPTGLAGHLCPR